MPCLLLTLILLELLFGRTSILIGLCTPLAGEAGGLAILPEAAKPCNPSVTRVTPCLERPSCILGDARAEVLDAKDEGMVYVVAKPEPS